MADKRKGWILLYRSIRDNWIWENKPFDPARAWIDLILDANHDNKKFTTRSGRLVKVKRGQTWVSLRKLSERWGWSQERVLRFLKTLEEEQMIARSATPSGTLLTLINYGDFQDRPSAHKSTDKSTDKSTGLSRTKNSVERTTKELRKEASLLNEGKGQEDDSSWFDELEDENVTTEH